MPPFCGGNASERQRNLHMLVHRSGEETLRVFIKRLQLLLNQGDGLGMNGHPGGALRNKPLQPPKDAPPTWLRALKTRWQPPMQTAVR